MGSMLRCVQCPEVGGDTIWINMVAAYENLPDDVKARIASLKAVHEFLPLFGIAVPEDQHEAMRKKFPPVDASGRAHAPGNRRKDPLCQRGVHDSSGELRPARPRSNIASASTTSWPKWTCCSTCFARRRRPSIRFACAGNPNTIAFWDNRACQHYAVQDYFPAPRHMMRATIIGDRPV